MSEPVIDATGLMRVYREGPAEVRVLEQLSLTMAAGDMLAVVGSSGSGKTTLLNLLGGLDQPDAGTVSVCGQIMDERPSILPFPGCVPSDRCAVRYLPRTVPQSRLS